MLKKCSPLVLASLLGIGAFVMPASTASAASLPHVEQAAARMTANTGMLQQVRKDGRRHWKHHGKNRHHWRHRHRGHRFNHFGIYTPLIFGGYGYGGYGYGGYGYSGSPHQAWCANRYRSYNWYDNTWVSYSGRVYQCRSPFRY